MLIIIYLNCINTISIWITIKCLSIYFFAAFISSSTVSLIVHSVSISISGHHLFKWFQLTLWRNVTTEKSYGNYSPASAFLSVNWGHALPISSLRKPNWQRVTSVHWEKRWCKKAQVFCMLSKLNPVCFKFRPPWKEVGKLICVVHKHSANYLKFVLLTKLFVYHWCFVRNYFFFEYNGEKRPFQFGETPRGPITIRLFPGDIFCVKTSAIEI